MAIWQFTMVLFPQQNKKVNLDSIYIEDGYDVSDFWKFFNKKLELIEDIGLFLNRDAHFWDKDSFHWGDGKITDISLSINEHDDCIENFSIRIDVREKFDVVFIEKVINVAKKYNLQMLNIGERKMIEINAEDIHKEIKNSRAYRFKNF